jgi:hypothetical protein
VSALTFRTTPDSTEELGGKASSAGLALTLISDAAPLALIAVAAVLLLIVIIPRRNRRPGASASRDPAAATAAFERGTPE